MTIINLCSILSSSIPLILMRLRASCLKLPIRTRRKRSPIEVQCKIWIEKEYTLHVVLVKLTVLHYLVRILSSDFEERTRKIEAKCLHSPPSKATYAATKANSQTIVTKEWKQRAPAPYWAIDFIIRIWASFIKCKQMICCIWVWWCNM